MDNKSRESAHEEFEALDLGDLMRDRRFRKLLERLATKPAASIPSPRDNFSETMATYQFLATKG